MSWVAAAIAGGTIISGALTSGAQRDAANSASNSNERAGMAGIEEQRRQFDEINKLLFPYVSAGESGLSGQLALLGFGGPDAEQAAIERIQKSPTFSALSKAGEEGILSNASATGGLRGGNVQSALSQFRPGLLASLIDSQYNKFAGLSSIGQSSAAGVGAAGQTSANNITELLQRMGSSQAAQAIANGRITGNQYGDINSAFNQFMGDKF